MSGRLRARHVVSGLAAVSLAGVFSVVFVASPAFAQDSSSTTSEPTSSVVTLGSSNTDSATVTGSDPTDPTGTVSFYACGPGASSCTPSGTPFDTETVSGASNPDTVTSVSGFTPNSAGTWCFAAVYSGDSNYDGSSDDSSDECFTVSQASSTTSTSPTSASIALGSPNTDNVTVTGSVSGVDPTGTVTFYECGPDSAATGCTSGTEFDTETLSGTTNPGTATSVSFTPASAGTWCFGAVYSGDTNYTGSSDVSTDECFTVTVATPTLTSAPTTTEIAVGSSDTDNVTVTGNATGGAPTGTLLFYECGPTAAPVPCTSKLNKVGSGAVTLTPGSNNQSTAKSGALTTAEGNPGYFCFGVYYSGSTEYATGSDTSTTECFEAINPPSITSFTPTSGKSGAVITIKGSGLAGAVSVTIGSVTEKITLDKAAKIQVTVSKTTKTGYVTVTTVGGSTTTTQKFKFT
jgi:hypothetical protein